MDITDNKIRDWAISAKWNGGSFVAAFGESILAADPENFTLLRPVATQLIAKYPKYLEM